MKKNKTAIILTIVSILLWAMFLIIRLSIPKGAHLSYQIDAWLLILSAILTSTSMAFWLSAFARQWNSIEKIIAWCLHGVMSLFWILVVASLGSYYGQMALFVDRYVCDNDNKFVMRSYFNAPHSSVSLYQKQGLLERNVCFIDNFYPFDDPKLFVFEDSDAIVVQHSEYDSVYTDVYHFNGDIYQGSAKDSILDMVKRAE